MYIWSTIVIYLLAAMYYVLFFYFIYQPMCYPTTPHSLRRSKINNFNQTIPMSIRTSILIVLATVLLGACTQETQNKFSRSVQNFTGTDGILEIYAGEKLVKRFIEIDKLSTAVSTSGSAARPYRFGYGILDANLNSQKDPEESKVYFEFSDYSTSYIFYEKPKNSS